jgi:hypothetical protein
LVEHLAGPAGLPLDEATGKRLLDDNVLPSGERLDCHWLVQVIGDTEVHDVDPRVIENVAERTVRPGKSDIGCEALSFLPP